MTCGDWYVFFRAWKFGPVTAAVKAVRMFNRYGEFNPPVNLSVKHWWHRL